MDFHFLSVYIQIKVNDKISNTELMTVVNIHNQYASVKDQFTLFSTIHQVFERGRKAQYSAEHGEDS